MAVWDVRRFADPDALRRVRPQYLLRLLRPHTDYFADRGLVLPTGRGGDIDYQALASILLDPDDAMPASLVDALYYVNEMATTEGMDALLAAAASAGLALDASGEVSPGDVAVQVWLRDPRLLERKHAEQFLSNRRTYLSFQSDRPQGDVFEVQERAIAALERGLDAWFETKKRGRGCRVFAFPRDDALWFLVRHGEPFRREGTHKEDGRASVYFRPEKHDIVIYDPALGELRVNAGSKGEIDLYRGEFGLHLFGSADHFPGTAKYTLDPLRAEGEAALACTDIEDMQWVKLIEVRYFWGGPVGETEIRRADDLFAVLHRRGAEIPTGCRLVQATFRVKFADAKIPRSVSIRPSNIAKYTRDDDGTLVEQWLSRRGFIVAEQAAADE